MKPDLDCFLPFLASLLIFLFILFSSLPFFILFDLFFFIETILDFFFLVKVSITVGDVNDKYPEFLFGLYKGQIKENVVVGTAVLAVKAVDEDQGNTVKYIITTCIISAFLK